MFDFDHVDWAWGGMMTAVGMSVVFGLLALLWLLLRIIGQIDAATARRAALTGTNAALEAAGDERRAAASEPAVPSPTVTITHADGFDDATLAAIAVAVIKHADIRRKQAAPEMRAAAPGSQLWASRWVAVGRGLQNATWRRR